MSKKKSWAIGVIVGVMVVLAGFFFGYLFGLSQCKPCPEVKKVVVKKPIAAKKSPKKVVQALTPVPAPAPVPALIPAPASAPAPTVAPMITVLAPMPRLYTLRINVVEWNESFGNGDLFSRKLGPLIREGMAKGTIKRASMPITFKVEWRQCASRLAGKTIHINGETRVVPPTFADGYAVEVTTQNGQATIAVDPAMIGPETQLFIWPDAMMISPPDNLPLVTNPGELAAQINNGVQETYLHFILPYFILPSR